jgi:hypothetical protein
MIQLRKSAVVVTSGRGATNVFQKYCVLLPKLLEPELLDVLLSRLDQGNGEKVHKGIGVEVILDDLRALRGLAFHCKFAEFPRCVRNIPCSQQGSAGACVAIRTRGITFRHTDTSIGERLVGMSLNLGPKPYKGGLPTESTPFRPHAH